MLTQTPRVLTTDTCAHKRFLLSVRSRLASCQRQRYRTVLMGLVSASLVSRSVVITPALILGVFACIPYRVTRKAMTDPNPFPRMLTRHATGRGNVKPDISSTGVVERPTAAYIEKIQRKIEGPRRGPRVWRGRIFAARKGRRGGRDL